MKNALILLAGGTGKDLIVLKTLRQNNLLKSEIAILLSIFLKI